MNKTWLLRVFKIAGYESAFKIENKNVAWT